MLKSTYVRNFYVSECRNSSCKSSRRKTICRLHNDHGYFDKQKSYIVPAESARRERKVSLYFQKLKMPHWQSTWLFTPSQIVILRCKLLFQVYSRYAYDTDKELTQLRFVSNDGVVIGAINWYAIHGTTLNNTNTLVSSDNVGYAALALEKLMESESLAGRVRILKRSTWKIWRINRKPKAYFCPQSKFVGAFASSNLGDVSPNVDGPKCHQSGTECDTGSKCTDMFEECFALGPGKDMFESVAIIGHKLAEGAWVLILFSMSFV